MPLSALALVLLAALLHALWNIAAKQAGGDHRFAFLSVVFMVTLWLPAGLWFGLREVPLWGAAQWGIVAFSAVLHVAYFLCLLKGYRVADLTVVYPVARGSAPLLTAAAAILLLGESLSALGVAGVVGIALGVFAIAGGPGLWRRWRRPAGLGAAPLGSASSALEAQAQSQSHARVLRGLRWGALTGALIASYSVVDAYAVKALLIGPVVFDYMCNLLRLPILLPLVWGDGAGLRQALRTQWKPALIVATLGPLGYILVLYAVQQAQLSHVAPAREASMLFAALLAGKLLGEGERLPRLAGAACIGLGVVALAWA